MLTRNSDRKSVAGKWTGRALCVLASLAFAQVVTAAGPQAGGGASAGARVGVGGAAGTSIGIGTGAAAAGRVEAASPSTRALENSNGRIVEDREFGLDRAQERMSEQGAEHQKATEAKSKASAQRAKRGASGRSSSAGSADTARTPAAGASSSTSTEGTGSTKQ